MKIILSIGLILLICVSGILDTKGFRNTTTNPRDTEEDKVVEIVRQYCFLVSEGRYQEIPKITAPPPRVYFTLPNERKIDRKSSSSETKKTVQPSANPPIMGGSVGGDEALNQLYLKMINVETSQLFNKNSVYIKEIVGVTIRREYASVVVAVGSQKSASYAGKEEFLLVFRDGSWKVFYERQFSELNAKTDPWPPNF